MEKRTGERGTAPVRFSNLFPAIPGEGGARGGWGDMTQPERLNSGKVMSLFLNVK
jgi:hypothetical protein